MNILLKTVGFVRFYILPSSPPQKKTIKNTLKKQTTHKKGFKVARIEQTQDVSPAAPVSVIVRESRSLWGSLFVCRRNIGVALSVP